MTRKRRIFWFSTILLILAGGIGGYCWHRHSTAVDRKVCELVYEAADWPDTKWEKRLKGWKLEFLLREKPQSRGQDAVESEIKAIGRASTPGLISLFHDENELVRLYAAFFAGRIGDPVSAEPLIDLVEKDKDELVRFIVVESLGWLGDKKAVVPLASVLLKDNSEGIREHAAIVLCDIGDSRAVDSLIEALQKDESSVVRYRSAEALGQIGDQRAVPALIRALDDKGLNVRGCAIEALGYIGDPRAIEPLREVLEIEQKSGYVSYRISEALHKLGVAATFPGSSGTFPAEESATMP
ncbi:MAG: HEAT repeat domain-containing protein [Planctomycetes bacterium]|nr:HEAT repeat domain-containing protein [Planctomycetota bacterium]